jgi:hypothetical protein
LDCIYRATYSWFGRTSFRRELEKTSDVTQRDALFNDFLQIVPVANDEKALSVDEQTTDPFGGFAKSPLVSDVQDESLVGKLQKQFSLEKFDAQHLAQALSNSANIFLTRDERHFLKQRKRQAIEKDFNIKIRLPSEV